MKEFGCTASTGLYDVLVDANRDGVTRLQIGHENDAIYIRSMASVRPAEERTPQTTNGYNDTKPGGAPSQRNAQKQDMPRKFAR